MHRIFDIADAQPTVFTPPQAASERFEPVGVRQQRAGFGQKRLAVSGQANALLIALKQHQSETFLKLGNLPAQRRLGNVQPFGSAADVLLFRHRDEVFQLT